MRLASRCGGQHCCGLAAPGQVAAIGQPSIDLAHRAREHQVARGVDRSQATGGDLPLARARVDRHQCHIDVARQARRAEHTRTQRQSRRLAQQRQAARHLQRQGGCQAGHGGGIEGGHRLHFGGTAALGLQTGRQGGVAAVELQLARGQVGVKLRGRAAQTHAGGARAGGHQSTHLALQAEGAGRR